MDGSMMALGVEPLMPSLIGRTGMVEGSVPQRELRKSQAEGI